MFCKDQGTPQQWGGQAACRAVRDAGGLPHRNPGAFCALPPPFHTSTCGTGSLQHRSGWDQPTVTHPVRRLVLLRAPEPELEQSPPVHPCARAHPHLRHLLRKHLGKSMAAAVGCPGMAVGSQCVPDQAQGFVAGGFSSLERLCRPRGEQDKENQLTHMTPFGAFSQNVGAASWFQVSSLLLSPDNLCSSRTLPHITQQISAPACVLRLPQFLAYKRASPRKHLPFLPHRKQERGAQQGLLQPARRPGQCRSPEHMGEGPPLSGSCAASLCPTAHSTGDAADYISQRTVYC